MRVNASDSIFIAGHRGLVGSAIVRRLRALGFDNLLLRTREELDLRDSAAVRDFFLTSRPRYVFFAAAKVGGIMANNTRPAEFIEDNLLVQLSVINAAHASGVHKLLFLGSSCIYPKHAPQPIAEESLLTGPLEPTNEPYAIAKIAGIVMCQSYNRQYGTRFISAMPTNLYGPGDNFGLESGHVVPALMRRFHEAKISGAAEVGVWGTGSPRREFLHVDDCADACVHLMQTWDELNQIVNVGYGDDISIRELAELIRDVVGYTGAIVWDSSKPDGTPRKLLDSSRLYSSGWTPHIALRDGLASSYRWFLDQGRDVRTED
jgi:GDP-L-fucose synthase